MEMINYVKINPEIATFWGLDRINMIIVLDIFYYLELLEKTTFWEKIQFPKRI
jgi:hypothetical protein